MERGVPFDVELELQPDAGRRGWIHVLGEADRDADGQIRLTGKCLLTGFPETASGRMNERCQGVLRDGPVIERAKYYPPLGIWMHMNIWRSDIGLTLCLYDDTGRMNAQRKTLHLKMQPAALKAAGAR